MEILTTILSIIMGLLSPIGTVVDSVAEDTIRDQLHKAEVIDVRIDATPSHQLLAGRVDRVRIAGRGLYPLEGVRIDTLDIETDPIDVNFSELRQGDVRLDQPFQGIVRLVLTVEDINRALRSNIVMDSLRNISLNIVGEDTIGGLNQSDFVDASVQIVANDRLRFQTLIREQNTGEELDIVLEFGLNLINGHQIQFLSPELIANGESFPSDLLIPLMEGFATEFTLRNFESLGITIRLIKLELTDTEIELVAFSRIETSSPFLDAE